GDSNRPPVGARHDGATRSTISAVVFAARAVDEGPSTFDAGQTQTTMKAGDPVSVRASDLDLPRAWPDEMFRRLSAFLRFLRTLLFGGRKVQLPPELPGGAALPEYLLREFHRMPNGYYSYMLVDGYERGFERAMLGQVALVRAWIAQQLRD